MEEIEKTKNKGFFLEFLEFLWMRKAWWLLPIAVVLAIVAFLVVLMQNSYISPFIYAL